MKVWQFYSLATGEFTGQSFYGPESMLAANTPAGRGAIQGRYDREKQRVDLETGRVIDNQ